MEAEVVPIDLERITSVADGEIKPIGLNLPTSTEEFLINLTGVSLRQISTTGPIFGEISFQGAGPSGPSTNIPLVDGWLLYIEGATASDFIRGGIGWTGRESTAQEGTPHVDHKVWNETGAAARVIANAHIEIRRLA